jgi:hypothetical protein
MEEESIKGAEHAEARRLDPADERQVGSLDLAIPRLWCQIGAKPRRTSRTERTSLTTFSLIFVREERPRSAEFAPARI